MTILRNKINYFLSAINKSIETKNWHSALAVSLMLPDICGKLENPKLQVGDRYRKWFNTYLYDKYNSFSDFTSAEDFYLLRCAYLHSGESDISDKKLRELVDEFKFVAPKVIDGKFTGSHRIKINQYLILRIDRFSLEICEAVKDWVEYNENDKVIQQRATKMIMINSDPISYNGVYVE